MQKTKNRMHLAMNPVTMITETNIRLTPAVLSSRCQPVLPTANFNKDVALVF